MSNRLLLIVVLLSSLGLTACKISTEPTTPEPLVASVETPNEAAPSDMDDPAVWVAAERQRSMVIAAAKEGGWRVYDLEGKALQQFVPGVDSKGKPLNRFNNVDVQYNFNLNGRRVDLAVFSDRRQDRLAIYKIDRDDPRGPLVNVTSPEISRLFPTRPNPDDRSKTVANAEDGKNTAYGLALWRDRSNDRLYALVNQNNEAIIDQWELVARPDNTVSARPVKKWQFAYQYKGQDLTQKSETDPQKDFSPQFEGMVVDQQTGILYAGQEDVGIWRVNLKTGVAEGKPFYETRTFDPHSRIARDVEGLTIWYGRDGRGYLLASSQGKAHGKVPNPTPGLDNTFAVFMREGDNAPIGSFSIGANRGLGIDAVQESDGADISTVALPGFPFGVLITQDGYNDDLNHLDGTVKATNLKFTPWQRVANSFSKALSTDSNYDPRNP
ncbi:phytase [Parachitinimonas caeni]|uniref:Phytase n=1 Tax=Parachitinimonas caeni TaxID=3031301 RepID=A0ABT7DUD5_9NEIS|nr:phytase [Parachitinimonas caeni]MDK2123584.1 phytase [Parachitinimonas caeni]